MKERSDIVEIAGPVVTIYQPEWYVEHDFRPDIVYSVQLLNGMIVTSPNGFPAEDVRGKVEQAALVGAGERESAR